MPFTILLTGFGPFPGAPVNPTGALVEILADLPGAGEHRRAHVFTTSYDTVDTELPDLVARERPAALLMFGVALRAKRLRVETRARNVLSLTHADASGRRPADRTIAPQAPLQRPLRAPAARLVAAAQGAGTPAALSSDAGSYLCNYLCWRASEAAAKTDGLRLIAFVHVPNVRLTLMPQAPHGSKPMTLGDLLPGCDAIVQAAAATARIRR